MILDSWGYGSGNGKYGHLSHEVFIVNIRKLCRTAHFAQLHGICTKALPQEFAGRLVHTVGPLGLECKQKGIVKQIWRKKKHREALDNVNQFLRYPQN